jgi:hypothetical protein
MNLELYTELVVGLKKIRICMMVILTKEETFIFLVGYFTALSVCRPGISKLQPTGPIWPAELLWKFAYNETIKLSLCLIN